jgi:hypothetical protein
MAATDASPFPIKNQALRITFPIFDADGDLVTGATALDSEISKDAGTFADCTNEATEIATSSGMYYLDLTSTEMNADTVAIIVKTSSSGAKTTPIVIYPQKAGHTNMIADDLLNRDMSAVSDTNARTPLNAFRAIRNRWANDSGTLRVYKENDTTEAWTATLTGSAGANPLIESNPA